MNLDAIKEKLCKMMPYYANIINNVEFEDSYRTPSVATDGKKIFYNSQFLNNTGENNQLFALANAICHYAFRDNEKAEGKDRYIWNIACDAVINNFLKKNNFTRDKDMPSVNIPDAYDAEALYEEILYNYNNASAIYLNGLIDGKSSGKH